MFNRFEALKKAIQDKSIDSNTLALIIDFHANKGKLQLSESDELMALLYPPQEEAPEE